MGPIDDNNNNKMLLYAQFKTNNLYCNVMKVTLRNIMEDGKFKYKRI